MIRCDKPMRRSKERTVGIDEFGIKKWACTGECSTCICGLVKQHDGTWEHTKYERAHKKKGEE